jgi:hypothetical protein
MVTQDKEFDELKYRADVLTRGLTFGLPDMWKYTWCRE